MRALPLLEEEGDRLRDKCGVVGLYGVFKPALLAAYKQHLAESNPITDHPTSRILDRSA